MLSEREKLRLIRFTLLVKRRATKVFRVNSSKD